MHPGLECPESIQHFSSSAASFMACWCPREFHGAFVQPGLGIADREKHRELNASLLLMLTLLHWFFKCLLPASNTVYEFHPSTERKDYRFVEGTLTQRVDVRGEKLSPDSGLSSLRCQGVKEEGGGRREGMRAECSPWQRALSTM